MGGTFYEPTILVDVPAEARIAYEEIFSTVAPIFSFKDEVEAVRMVHDTEFGLAAYFFARDVRRVWRVSALLQFGMVGMFPD